MLHRILEDRWAFYIFIHYNLIRNVSSRHTSLACIVKQRKHLTLVVCPWLYCPRIRYACSVWKYIPKYTCLMYIVQLRGTLIITAPTIRIRENKSEKDIPGVSKNWTCTVWFHVTYSKNYRNEIKIIAFRKD